MSASGLLRGPIKCYLFLAKKKFHNKIILYMSPDYTQHNPQKIKMKNTFTLPSSQTNQVKKQI